MAHDDPKLGDPKSVTGGCLCGGVRYTVGETPLMSSVCHCDMCRRWTGGPMMALHPKTPITLNRDETLSWYDSSDWAERGFCHRCGASLFYRLKQAPDDLIVGAGSLDDQSVVDGLESHIFVDEKPAFYDFADTSPRLSGAEAIAMFTAQSGKD